MPIFCNKRDKRKYDPKRYREIKVRNIQKFDTESGKKACMILLRKLSKNELQQSSIEGKTNENEEELKIKKERYLMQLS